MRLYEIMASFDHPETGVRSIVTTFHGTHLLNSFPSAERVIKRVHNVRNVTPEALTDIMSQAKAVLQADAELLFKRGGKELSQLVPHMRTFNNEFDSFYKFVLQRDRARALLRLIEFNQVGPRSRDLAVSGIAAIYDLAKWNAAHPNN